MRRRMCVRARGARESGAVARWRVRVRPAPWRARLCRLTTARIVRGIGPRLPAHSYPVSVTCEWLTHRLFVSVTEGLASWVQCWHYACMSVQITIRDVPEKVRDELAARAALQGKSMQEFLHAELRRMVARPSIDVWLRQVRRRKSTAQSRVSAEEILKNRDADRR